MIGQVSLGTLALDPVPRRAITSPFTVPATVNALLAAGVEVVLAKDGRAVGRATTDTFGEFKIDRLEPDSGRVELAPAYDLLSTLPCGDDHMADDDLWHRNDRWRRGFAD